MNYLTQLCTIGDSYWSTAERVIRITKLTVPYINDEKDFGELRVFFNTKDWKVAELGLIYTDTLFEFELIQWLKSIGFDSSDVTYSEQGMQGDDYVSFDVGPKFINSWHERGLNNVEAVECEA